MRLTPAEINSKNCWQIGTGDDTRSYLDIFLKYGIALVGPGDPGKEGEPNTKLFYETNPEVRNWGAILSNVEIGEWILARKGVRKILAVGQVEKKIDYSNLFSDVEGWNLQHFVKVKWYLPDNPENIIQFDSNVLVQSTIQRCRKQVVYDQIYKTAFVKCPREFEVEDFFVPKEIDLSDITNMLVDQGLRIQDAENVSSTIQRIIRLAQWYRKNDKETLESEIVAFLILPLLIALGWSEQKMKLEYQNIDIALFIKAFTGDYQSTPEFIIEAKTFNNGLAFTDAQMKIYGEKYPNCKNFIATNGYRYKIFFKDKNKLIQKGYFNLLRLNERNVLYDTPLTTIESIFSISNLH